MPIELAFGHVPTEPYPRHVGLVQLAEDLGFSASWIADQTLYRDPYALLTLLAERTNTIDLGIGVTNPYTRHPAMTARTVASVAEVAHGRVMLGIGAGNRRELLDPLHLEASGIARRIHETVVIVQRLLTGEVVDFVGEHYAVEGIGLDFAPAYPVPIYVGGRGQLVLEVAGEVADGAIIGGLCTPSGIRYALDAIGKGAARGGRNLEDVRLVSWVTCIVADDAAAARDEIREAIAHIIGGAPDKLFTYLEIPEKVIDEVKTAYRSGGKEAARPHVTDSCIDAFAIIGGPEECSERILALEAAGIDQLAVLMSTGTVDDHERRLRTLASSVAPHLGRGGA